MDATITPRWGGVVGRLARIGALPADNHEEALRKETLVLYASISTALAVVWVATYWALGLHLSAAIPFAYQIASVISLVVFATTKRYLLFRRSQLSFGLVLPF